MIGFAIGALCVVGLVKVLRHRHGWHSYGGYCGDYGGRFNGGAWGGGGGMRRGFGARWFLRSLFERLDTTPGQEKVIVAALDRLRAERGAVRGELKETRAAIARVVEGGLVDDAALEDTFARHDRTLAALRVSFVEALKTVCEALDERQRKELASLISGGGLFRRARFDGPEGMWA
jgi:hypothetical protein